MSRWAFLASQKIASQLGKNHAIQTISVCQKGEHFRPVAENRLLLATKNDAEI